MRHRLPRHAVLACALGGALALGACGGQPSGDLASTGASATSAQASEVSIPDDFPLSAGMGGPEDTIATSRTGTGLRDLELCRTTPLRGLGTRDRMVADDSGGESADTRELLVLSGDEEATSLSEEIAALVTDCDEAVEAGGEQVVTHTEVLESRLGPAPAVTLLQTYTFDGETGTGATVLHVVPVGPALLVTSTYGRWTPGQAEQALEATVGPLRDTVSAMTVFGDAPSSPLTPLLTPAETPTRAPAEIPADFPLDVGFPADGGDVRVSPPSPEGDGIGEVEMCGRVVWPQRETPDGLRRLVASALAPEDHEWRELFVHAGPEQASSTMDVLRQATAECRTSRNLVWTLLERDTGHDTVTVGLTYSGSLGSTVFQVTRVGSARLLVSAYGEGSLASLDGQADEVTGTTKQILPAMCVFTKTGC